MVIPRPSSRSSRSPRPSPTRWRWRSGGWDYVDSRINVEPSGGEAFNEISLVGDPPRPANPLVNIGAIAASGCIPDYDFDRIQAFYQRLAGHDLSVDEEVYAAELAAGGARNRALAWLLASVGGAG